jgi:hypothetical protein
MDNYRFYLSARVQNFKPTEPDLIGEVLHSSGASVGPRDGDLDGCTCFSCHSNLEHCSGLGLKANRPSFPLMWNWIYPAPTLICAFVVLRKGLPSMRGVFMSSCMSSTTKSTSTKKFLIFSEYFQRFLQDSEPIGRLVTGTLMLVWVLNSWACQRPSWAWHWRWRQGHIVHAQNSSFRSNNQ